MGIYFYYLRGFGRVFGVGLVCGEEGVGCGGVGVGFLFCRYFLRCYCNLIKRAFFLYSLGCFFFISVSIYFRVRGFCGQDGVFCDYREISICSRIFSFGQYFVCEVQLCFLVFFFLVLEFVIVVFLVFCSFFLIFLLFFRVGLGVFRELGLEQNLGLEGRDFYNEFKFYRGRVG